MLKYIRVCEKKIMAMLALSSVNVMFPVTSKMVSPNKPNSMNFYTEIGLKRDILRQTPLLVMKLFSI